MRLFHVHHKPLYAAIDEPDNRNRKPVGLGRAVERLMILDGVLADTSLVWLGTERDKHRHFISRLGNRVEPHEYPRLVFGNGPNATTRCFPDKLPIRVEPFGRRHVFLYTYAYEAAAFDHLEGRCTRTKPTNCATSSGVAKPQQCPR